MTDASAPTADTAAEPAADTAAEPAADTAAEAAADTAAEPDQPTRDLSAHRVVAVVVSHDGARWLPGTLTALARQRHRPTHVVAVDVASADSSSRLLAAAAGPDGPIDAVIEQPAGTGFATAANAGAAAAPTRSVGVDAARDWVWVLHDDSAPQPGALAALLTAADTQPSVAVLGPKVVGWDDPRRLLEIGVTISRSGRRETGLERHEQDQGQHDGQHEVLAVGSAGMLVRRDVWDALGGFDRRLPMFRDDVDLGWRANAAGHRVVVVTDAVVHHAEATARGRRALPVGRPHRVDRASALYVLLANAGSGWLAVTWLRLVVVQLVRALAFLLGKAGAEAGDELAAASSVLLRPGLVRAGRQARRGSRLVARRHYRSLFPPRGQQLRLGMDWLGGLLATGEAPAGATGAIETGPVDDEAASFGEGPTGVWRQRLVRPAPLTVLALLVVALLAWRGLYRGGTLHGGSLLPFPVGAADLWRTFTTSWHPVGQGSGLAAPPSLAVLGALSGLMLGHAGWTATLLLLLAVPLAGITAWAALSPLGLSSRLRVIATITYALSPSLLSGVAMGRLGTVLAAVLLPLVGWAAARCVGADGTGSTRAAATGVVLLAVLWSFAPVLWLPLAVLAILGAALVAHSLGDRLRLLSLPVLPVLLLAPWSLRWLAEPTQLVLESGLPLTSSDDAPWRVLLLDPGGPVVVPLLLSVGLVLAGFAALARAAERPAVRAGLVAAATGLLWALALATITVTPSWGRLPVAPWPGPSLVLATAGLIVAAAVAAEGTRRRLSERAVSWRQPVTVVVVALALVVPAACGLWWLARGALHPLVRGNPDPLPAFVQAAAAEPERVRTLVLEPAAGRLGYTLLRDRPAQLGDVEVAPAAETTAGLDELVGEIASGRGGVAVAELSGYAVQFVLVSPPVDPTLEETLDSVPGLIRVSNPGEASLWRLEQPTGRLQLTEGTESPMLLPSGEVDAVTAVPNGSGNRELLVAETADAGWRASIDGTKLAGREVDGWAQGFVVPPAGGELEVEHRSAARTAWLVVEGVLVVVVVVAALPARRRDEEVVV